MAENVYEALFELQGRLRGVQKDKKNDHFKNRYATLEQVTDTIRPHMQELGLLWIQTPGEVTDGCINLTTNIMHVKSGSCVATCMEMPLAKRDPQGAGSAMTYAMRYSLMAMLGLPPTDDDAETAIDRNETRPAPENQAPKNEESRKAYKALQDELRQQKSIDDLKRWANDPDVKSLVEKIPADWKAEINAEWARMKKEFEKAPKSAGDTVQGVLDAFPGSRVINETHTREQSPLEAG